MRDGLVQRYGFVQANKLTWAMFVIPRTKHIASSMLDLPEPLRPVIALNDGSHPTICVRTGYDLKPGHSES
jgi:hypothetical protein